MYENNLYPETDEKEIIEKYTGEHELGKNN